MMNLSKPKLFIFFHFVLFTLGAGSGAAEPQANEVYLPEALKPWVSWVLEKDPAFHCPLINKERNCSWPGKLDLNLEVSSGTFRYAVVTDKRESVELPGDASVWPLGITASRDGVSTTLPVLDRNNVPSVELEKGSWLIEGKFLWDEMPEFLRIPLAAAQITALVRGKELPYTKLNSRGELLLRGQESEQADEKDSLQLQVHRMLEDGLPFHIRTRLELKISGKSRQLLLGQVLPTGLTPLEASSKLSYSFASDYSLTVQAKPGEYLLDIDSVLPAPPERLQAPDNHSPGWPKEEVWVWSPSESLRSVEISGAPQIDSQRTTLPEHWKSYASYLIRPVDTLQLTQTRRGEESQAPNTLNLTRSFWLDLDGRGYTVQDSFQGRINQGWRLNALPGTKLGRVALSNEDQVITNDPLTSSPGVELREQNLSLTAESRLSDSLTSFSAVGWDHDVNSLSLNLMLPPGWTFIHASGVDMTDGSWLSSWTLLAFFGVLVIAISSGRLLGFAVGAIALLAMILFHQQLHAPYQIWFHLLGSLALLQVLPNSRFRTLIKGYFFLALACLVLAILPFILSQIRLGMFPHLTNSQVVHQSLFFPASFFMLLGLASALGAAVCFVGFLSFLISKSWKRMLQAIVCGFFCFIGCFALFGISSLFGSHLADKAQLPGFSAARAPVQRMTEPVAPLMKQQAHNASQESMSIGSYSDYRAVDSIFSETKKADLQQIDPRASVQTGPGIPSWTWTTKTLSWNGPVTKEETVKLLLFGPGINFILSFLRIFMVLVFTACFFRAAKTLSLPAAVSLILLPLLFHGPSVSHADSFPNELLLRELEARVTRDICRSDCTTAEQLHLNITEEKLSLSARISSSGDGAWSLPGPIDQFRVDNVRLDGKSTNALKRDTSGIIWVRVPAGVHTLEAEGSILPSSATTIQFVIRPKHLRVTTDDWELDGLTRTGSVGSSLQLLRKSITKTAQAQTGAETLLPHWFVVTRRLELGVLWTALTTVESLGDNSRAHLTRIPLIAGESVTSAETKVEDGNVLVAFPRGTSSYQWSSRLDIKPELSLRAPSGVNTTEVWTISCSSIYQCSPSKVVPTSTINDSQHILSYHPWPEEELLLNVVKPEGIPGKTSTIDRLNIKYFPGERVLSGELSFTVRSSQGDWLTLGLPEASDLEQVSIDGYAKSIRPRDNEVALPLVPGSRDFFVKWRMRQPMNSFFNLPQITLGDGAVNVITEMRIPSKRWVVYAWGSDWGPVFLYWGQLVFILAAALVLGYLKASYLKTYEWVLLGLGLSTLPLLEMLVVPIWLILLKVRKDKPFSDVYLFNSFQVVLCLATLAAIIVLYSAVSGGLLGSPDMGIAGYDSNSTWLRWYLDRSNTGLPTPHVLSFPLWVWRSLMFAWSCWLVFALLRWLKLGWQCLGSSAGLWKEMKSK